MVISVIAYSIGMVLMSTITPDTSRVTLSLFMVLVGFGVGFSFSLLPSASMHKMDYRHRGSANSTNSFFRSLGLALGITIFGSIQTKMLTSEMKVGFAKVGGSRISGNHGKCPNCISTRNTCKHSSRYIGCYQKRNVHFHRHNIFMVTHSCGIAVIAVFFMGNDRLICNEKTLTFIFGVQYSLCACHAPIYLIS